MPTPDPPSGAGPPPVGLSPGERAQWEDLAPGRRRRDWLLGRKALKQLLGPGADTSGLRFPHPRLSITHAGGRAYAVRTTGPGIIGTGIDYEGQRVPDPRTARFFLRPTEQGGPETGLLRLWTVKEALYKATPDNSEVVLLDYELGDVESAQGTARGPRGEYLRYASFRTGTGVLTVAVCLRPPPGWEAKRVAV